jgi:hypothetical protein
MEFVEFLNGGAPGFFGHAKAPDQLNVGDKEFVPFTLDCFWCGLSHTDSPC